MPICPMCASGKGGPHPAFCTEEIRFWSRVRKSDGCWEWTGGRYPLGYGIFWRPGIGNISTHRYAYILTHGPIPEGGMICHSCDNKICCNPAHLFLGSAQVNMDDMRAKGRARWGEYRRKWTHCPAGHEYTPDNLMKRSDGHRRCYKCWRAATDRRNAKAS